MKPRIRLALLLYLAPVALYLGRWSADPIGVDAVSAVTPGHVAVVGVLRSDDAALDAPAAPDAPLSADQVADLVRKAAYYSGGLHKALDPDAEWIVVKPGFVTGLEGSASGRQAIDAHVRVVGGVLRLLHSTSPEAEVSVVTGLPGNEALDARLAEIIGEPPLALARIGLLDMREEEHEEMEVPDGGESSDTYPVPIALLECDAVINVARVAVPGMASAMANLWGLARVGPDAALGSQSPARGVLVDLALLSEVDFTILDLLVVETAGGRQRLNLVAAGRDMISVDRVAAALPETGGGGIGALMLASARGLGQVNIGAIKVNGVRVDGTWTEVAGEDQGG